MDSRSFLLVALFFDSSIEPPDGLRYWRWGGDGAAVQPEKG